MCDTMVALGNATVDGSVIFAKNSDRHPNEAHWLEVIPAARHAPGSRVHCTYIEVPQVERTHALLLAKPFWIWGAEMGANDQGVVIGNEAVFSKLPAEKAPGLIGMDFIRLALERAATAMEALTTITTLLESYGQSGNCGFGNPMYYHNSYIIADPGEAWVLETVGRQWVAEKVRDVRSISNGLTIETEWDMASDGLIDFACEKGWCKKDQPFNFRQAYSDWMYTYFGDSKSRQQCSINLLQSQRRRITVESAMTVLRSHGNDRSPYWSPMQGISGADVCMHAGFGPIRISQSTGSMVSHLTPEQQTHWLTATSAPCTSIFKPVWIDAGLPDLGRQPTGEYDPDTIFWQHELLHREVLLDYANRLSVYTDELALMEARFFEQFSEVQSRPATERLSFSKTCFEAAANATRVWLERVRSTPVKKRMPFYSALAWQKFNRQAGLPA